MTKLLAKNNVVMITGTDTGIGKTVLAALLARNLTSKGFSIGVFKPVESGATPNQEGKLVPEDTKLLIEAAGNKQTIEEANLYCYPESVAPVIAAKLNNQQIDIKKIFSHLSHLSERFDFVIIEGAGGLLVPLEKNYTFCDFVFDASLPVIVVIGSRLGAINHAALTFEVLKRRNIKTVGYVFNDLFANNFNKLEEELFNRKALETNRELLREVAAGYQIQELSYLEYNPELSDKTHLFQFNNSSNAEKLSSKVIEYFSVSR